MLQAVMSEPGKIDFLEVARPRAGAGEVVIAVKRIGVCGSDIHVYHGQHPYTGYPVVQGHEVSGVIAEVGAGVDGFQKGDRVVFMPQVTCGNCYPCRHGDYHICEELKVMGFQTAGAAQEYFPLPASNVLQVPASMSLDAAAMIEPISVAVHALRRAGEFQRKNVLVLGAGPIGNLVAQVARAQGAAAVMITDISPYKLDKARECGIDFTLNPNEQELAEALHQHFGPGRADLILECVGAEAAIGQAVASARKGTTIVVVGVFGHKPVVDIGLVQDRELSLVGSLMYQRSDYETAIQLVNEGRLNLEPLITDYFPFERYLEAYQRIEAAQGNIMKVMISLGDQE